MILIKITRKDNKTKDDNRLLTSIIGIKHMLFTKIKRMLLTKKDNKTKDDDRLPIPIIGIKYILFVIALMFISIILCVIKQDDKQFCEKVCSRFVICIIIACVFFTVMAIIDMCKDECKK